MQKWFKWLGSVVVVTAVALFLLVAGDASAAKCPELSGGTVVRVAGSGKLALLSERKSWIFINDEAYLTWFPSLAKVKRAAAGCVEPFTESEDMIGYRPGSRLVSLGKAKEIYAIGPQNILHKIASPAVGKALYGANWRALAKKLNGRKAELYQVGTDLEEAVPHDGMLVKKKGDKAVYYVWNGELKMVDGKLRPFLLRDVRVLGREVFESLSVGSDTVTAAMIVEDPLQGQLLEESLTDAPATSDSAKSTDTTKPEVVTVPDTTPSAAVPSETTKSDASSGTGAFRFAASAGSDSDGWVNWNMEKASDLSGVGFTVYLPPSDVLTFYKDYDKGGKKIIFGSGYSWVFDDFMLKREPLNAGKEPLNLERVDIVESSDPADTKLSAREFAEAWVKGLQDAITNAPAKPGQPKTTCTFGASNYQTKTYGSVEFVTVNWLQTCLAPGADGAVAKLPTYAFAKSAKTGNILAIYFLNSNLEIRKAGSSEVDMSKDISAGFIGQFLGKLKF